MSLANLCFFSVWNAFYDVVYFQPYFLKDLHPAGDYAALLLDVVLLAALFFAGATLARRWGSSFLLGLMRLAFLLTLLIPVHGVYRLMVKRKIIAALDQVAARLGEPAWLLLMLAAGLAVLYALRRWHVQIARGAALLLLVFLPFAAVTFSRAVWAIGTAPSTQQMQDRALAPRLSVAQSSEPRVLWLVYDALDQRLAFDDRPASLELPELNRYRRQALYASRAYPPARSTLLSMPAFLTGRPVAGADPVGPDELTLSFSSPPESAPWSRTPNLFSRARQAGVNAGLVGWLHPYCRLFAESLAACSWVPLRHTGEPRGLLTRMRDHFLLLLESWDFAWRLMWSKPLGLELFPARKYRQDHIWKYQFVRDRAGEMAADGGLRLVVVHWPVPHLGTGPNPKEWYLDNLVLVDHSLAELRRRLQEANLWERTTILITSDHPWAYSNRLDGKTDPRVPFLLKLPGREAGVVYEEPFSAVLASGLVLAVLRGELREPGQVVEWLDQHRDEVALVEFQRE